MDFDTMPAAAELNPKGGNLARRRYQNGSFSVRNENWFVRYLEDVRDVNGEIHRVNRRVFLGSKADLTERMARRKAEPILAEINHTTQPKTVTTFKDFLTRWKPLAMPTTETGKNFRSAIKKYLEPTFGSRQLSDITTEDLQRFIVTSRTSASNVRNIIKCFKSIWTSARAWGYVKHNPLDGLILPVIRAKEQRFFREEDLCRILNAAPEPDKTLYWILAQTGLRIGEALALTWETVDLDHAKILVKSSVARGKLREQVAKTQAAKRVIPISPALANHLFTYRTHLWRDNPLNLVFTNSKTNPWKAENLLEGRFQPLLEELGIPKAGFHAFRHASATILSRMKVPTEIKLARMGHTEDAMTLRYTHVIEEDARKVAAGFDQFLLPGVVDITRFSPEPNESIENTGVLEGTRS